MINFVGKSVKRNCGLASVEYCVDLGSTLHHIYIHTSSMGLQAVKHNKNRKYPKHNGNYTKGIMEIVYCVYRLLILSITSKNLIYL